MKIFTKRKQKYNYTFRKIAGQHSIEYQLKNVDFPLFGIDVTPFIKQQAPSDLATSSKINERNRTKEF